MRREADGIRHYVHVGTGNYNAEDRRIYTDFGLFTCDDGRRRRFRLFNTLTGDAQPPDYRKALVAPGACATACRRSSSTIETHRQRQHVRIAMKMNALVDRALHPALYAPRRPASRSTCTYAASAACEPASRASARTSASPRLSAGTSSTPGSTASQRGDENAAIGSADLMPRNLDTRVELLTPVEDEVLRAQIVDTLDRSLADDTYAWDLQSEGQWVRRTGGSGRCITS